jgi:hypothetical protein
MTVFARDFRHPERQTGSWPEDWKAMSLQISYQQG